MTLQEYLQNAIVFKKTFKKKRIKKFDYYKLMILQVLKIDVNWYY